MNLDIPKGTVFQFKSSSSLVKLTGIKAHTLEELLHILETCPDSSIFYHTFSAFLKFREVQVPYNSDFAIWVADKLNEKALAEKLTALDFSEYSTLKALRERLIEIVEHYRHEKPDAFKKNGDEPFYLYDVTRIVYFTDKFAHDLRSFRDLLETASIYSMYFHFFESRLQTHLHADDFSTWMDESLSIPDLAHMIRKIDINVHTLEGLRDRIIRLIDEHIINREEKG